MVLRLKKNKLLAYAEVRLAEPVLKPERPEELLPEKYDPFKLPEGMDGSNVLNVTGCRYIIHERPYVFCNKPKRVKSSYCEEHSLVCGRLYKK
jgi:hypothetical protein